MEPPRRRQTIILINRHALAHCYSVGQACLSQTQSMAWNKVIRFRNSIMVLSLLVAVAFAVCSNGNTQKPTKRARTPINNTILITLYLRYLYCIEAVPHTENTIHTTHEYLQNYPFIYYIIKIILSKCYP